MQCNRNLVSRSETATTKRSMSKMNTLANGLTFEETRERETTEQRRNTMNRNITGKSIISLVALVMLTAMVAQAQTTWTGAALNNDWNTAGNWDNGVPINDTGTRTTINTTANITMSGAGTTRGMDVSAVGTSWADAAVLNISRDLLSGIQTNVTIGKDLTTGDTTTKHYAKVVHTSGKLTVGTLLNGSSFLRVGNTDSVALYEFGGAQGSAPTIEANYIDMGVGLRSSGTMSLKDHGTITLGAYVFVGGNGSTGELRVEGGNLTINVGTHFNLANHSGADGILRAVLTDDATFSTINVGGDVTLGIASTNRSKFYLELDDSYEHVHGRTFTILQSVGNFMSLGSTGGVFSNVADGQSIFVNDYEFIASYDYTPGANTFELMAYIPEPSTGLLMLLGGLGMLRRRKRG